MLNAIRLVSSISGNGFGLVEEICAMSTYANKDESVLDGREDVSLTDAPRYDMCGGSLLRWRTSLTPLLTRPPPPPLHIRCLLPPLYFTCTANRRRPDSLADEKVDCVTGGGGGGGGGGAVQHKSQHYRNGVCHCSCA